MHLERLLEKHFAPYPEALPVILTHSRCVAEKALAIARHLDDPTLDLVFVAEAALVHDIGVCGVKAPGIGCHGSEPYIRHGLIGRQLLEAEGLPRHALACERHIGVGLSVGDITAQNLPLPLRDMFPESREERLLCLADLFFSKRPGELEREKGLEEIARGLSAFGDQKVAIFHQWLREFRLLTAEV